MMTVYIQQIRKTKKQQKQFNAQELETEYIMVHPDGRIKRL